jgi:hypothetical protein
MIMVMLVMVALTVMGILALSLSSIERQIDSSFRTKFSADQSLSSAVQLASDYMKAAANFSYLDIPGYPAGIASADDACKKDCKEGDMMIHPVIGACTIIARNCSGGTGDDYATFDIGAACCFRTGPLLKLVSGNYEIFKVTKSSDIEKIKPKAFFNVPGAGSFVYGVYDLPLTVGGAGGAVSEARAVIEYGPIKKQCGSGTQYGDNC